MPNGLSQDSRPPLGVPLTAKERHAPSQRGNALGAAHDSGRLRILVVDDESVNRRVAAIQLEHQGHIMETAADGGEALRLCERMQFDCVLMDVRMPMLDGLETSRRLREREQRTGGHVAIIGMSTNAVADRERSVLAGMDDCVGKPFDPRAVVETAARIIAAHPRQDVAHGVKNQLAIVLGFCELVAGSFTEDDPRRVDMRRIEQAARTALRLLCVDDGGFPERQS
jgi:CheY-like chemotaxis protein